MKSFWKVKVAPLALALVALGGLVTGVGAVARADPSPGGGCPNGYVAAQTNASYAGAPGLNGSAGRGGSILVRNEVSGVGCFKINKAKAHLQFRWSTTGKLLSGGFWYQLVDCRTNKVVGSKSLSYPRGTKKKSGGGNASFAVTKGHKYKMRIVGQGEYQRSFNGLSGGLGRFYAQSPPHTDAKRWFDETSCRTAK